MSEQDAMTIRSWLRDRADAAPDPMPIVATVMADLDRVPQRSRRRRGSDAGVGIFPCRSRRPGTAGLGARPDRRRGAGAARGRGVPGGLAAPCRPRRSAACGRSPRRWSCGPATGSHLAFVLYDQVPLAALASPVPSAPMTGGTAASSTSSGCTPSPPTDRTFGSSLTGGSLGAATGCRPSPPTAVTCSSRSGAPHKVGTIGGDGWDLWIVSATGPEPPVEIGTAGEEVWYCRSTTCSRS